VGHASGFNGLLQLKVSQARVFQSSLKTGGGATRMMHVASSGRVEMKPKTDRLMRWVASISSTSTLPFLLY
jgi:hypothetical protein